MSLLPWGKLPLVGITAPQGVMDLHDQPRVSNACVRQGGAHVGKQDISVVLPFSAHKTLLEHLPNEKGVEAAPSPRALCLTKGPSHWHMPLHIGETSLGILATQKPRAA